jgi:hypothetical protein
MPIRSRLSRKKCILSMETYEHSQHELELLRLLSRGEKEIETGKGYDLEAVLAEADSLLKEPKP